MSRFFRTVNLVMSTQLRALQEGGLRDYVDFLRRYDPPDSSGPPLGAVGGSTPLFLIHLVARGVPGTQPAQRWGDPISLSIHEGPRRARVVSIGVVPSEKPTPASGSQGRTSSLSRHWRAGSRLIRPTNVFTRFCS